MKYCYIQPTIVGSTDKGFGYAYYSDLEFFNTKNQALKNGLKIVDSDDFWIGGFDGKNMVELWHTDMTERKNCDKELKGINEEFAF